MTRRLGLGLLILGLLLCGCTAVGDEPQPAPTTTIPSTATEPATSATPSASVTPRATPTATSTPKPRPKPHPISVQALIERSYDGRDLRLGRQIGSTGAYRRYLISYRGDGLRLTGVMNVPRGRGPFPVLVLNHGYIDPDVYVPGQGMSREQDYLARHGFVVLQVDYRGHAGSDDDPNVDYELRLPYAVDTINAVKAVKASKLRFLDPSRVGMMGRSMGGNVTLNALVAQPGLVDAAVIYASTSSLAADNWRQFYRPSQDRGRVNRRIERTYGLPEQNPEFWRNASPRPYFGRVTEPILIHHGLADDTCPISWSRATTRALKAAGKDVTFLTYRGEGHAFYGQWGRSIARTAEFFRANLKE